MLMAHPQLQPQLVLFAAPLDRVDGEIIALKMARKERIMIIKTARTRWRMAKKNMEAQVIVGFALCFPREISSIIASYIRVPLSNKSVEEIHNLDYKYRCIIRQIQLLDSTCI
jgi:hypothetical protein